MSIDLSLAKSNIRQKKYNENIFPLILSTLSTFFGKNLLTFYFQVKQKINIKNHLKIKYIKNNNLICFIFVKFIPRDKLNVSIKIKSKEIAL